MPNPDDPQQSPDVKVEVAAVHAASTQPPAALLREMSGVPTVASAVIGTKAPSFLEKRRALIPLLAKSPRAYLQAIYEEMEARPDLVEEPMELPFSLQKNTLAGPPVITFKDSYVSEGRGYLVFDYLDSNENITRDICPFEEGETRGFWRARTLQFSITYREGGFYYTGRDFRTIQMVR